MNDKELKLRWTISTNVLPVERFISSNKFRADLSPFGKFNGRWDFRGCDFLLRNLRFLDGCSLFDIDFSKSDFTHVRITNCVLHNLLFEKAMFEDTILADSNISHCTFFSCVIKSSGLGVKTNPAPGVINKIVTYENCNFEKCKIKNTSFSHAEFRNCTFFNNKYKNTDFGVSYFDDCVFTGKVEDVVFRGNYNPFDPSEKSDRIVCNPMRVSFENAELSYVEFSFNCDLSNVTMPLNDNYIRYDKWDKRLKHAFDVVSKLPKSDVNEILLKWIKVYMEIQKAKQQSWTIIIIDELRKDLGVNVANDFIRLLSEIDT